MHDRGDRDRGYSHNAGHSAARRDTETETPPEEAATQCVYLVRMEDPYRMVASATSAPPLQRHQTGHGTPHKQHIPYKIQIEHLPPGQATDCASKVTGSTTDLDQSSRPRSSAPVAGSPRAIRRTRSAPP